MEKCARKYWTVLSVALLGFSGAAGATPISITEINGSTDGGSVGGFTTVDWETELTTDTALASDDVDCIDSAGVTGNICFQGKNGADSDIDIVNDPAWWQYTAEHDNVFVTNQSWIELILPDNTLALALWVGASFNGSAWIGAYDSNGNYVQTVPNFSVGPGNTSGYGISTDGCSYITKVIVEPEDWGFGNLSISQGDVAQSCVSVPEPPTTGLFLLGLFGLALLRRQVAFSA
jgi:hypothetical protein